MVYGSFKRGCGKPDDSSRWHSWPKSLVSIQVCLSEEPSSLPANLISSVPLKVLAPFKPVRDRYRMLNVKQTLDFIWWNVLISQVRKQRLREVTPEGPKACQQHRKITNLQLSTRCFPSICCCLTHPSSFSAPTLPATRTHSNITHVCTKVSREIIIPECYSQEVDSTSLCTLYIWMH